MNIPDMVLWLVFLASVTGLVLLLTIWAVLGVRQRCANRQTDTDIPARVPSEQQQRLNDQDGDQ